MNTRSRSLFRAVLLALAPWCAPAWAEPVVHEAFDYLPGAALVGQAGGSGFAGAWPAPSNRPAMT